MHELFVPQESRCFCQKFGKLEISSYNYVILLFLEKILFVRQPAAIQALSTLDEKCFQGKMLKIGYQNYTPYVDSQWNIQEKAGMDDAT